MTKQTAGAGSLIAGRYVLLEQLRQNAAAELYLAEHQLLKNKLLIALVASNLNTDQGAFQRYQHTLRTLADINHEGLARATDFGETGDGRLFVALEHPTGETLGSLLSQGPLSQERAVALLSQIAQALAATHSQGIYHGRLSPDDILLDQRDGTDRIKVVGFGIAALTASETGPATLEGSASFFAAPEADTLPPSASGDVYALAAIAYQMITGAPLFAAKTLQEARRLHREHRPLSLLDTVPTIAEPYSATIDRALAKRPERRYQTLGRFIAALTGEVPATETTEERTQRLQALGVTHTVETALGPNPTTPQPNSTTPQQPRPRPPAGAAPASPEQAARPNGDGADGVATASTGGALAEAAVTAEGREEIPTDAPPPTNAVPALVPGVAPAPAEVPAPPAVLPSDEMRQTAPGPIETQPYAALPERSPAPSGILNQPAATSSPLPAAGEATLIGVSLQGAEEASDAPETAPRADAAPNQTQAYGQSVLDEVKAAAGGDPVRPHAPTAATKAPPKGAPKKATRNDPTPISREQLASAGALTSETLLPSSADERVLRAASNRLENELAVSRRQRPMTGPQEPYRDELDSSHGREWFAEGEAAEKALILKTASQPLPALYGSLDELYPDQRRGLSSTTVIIAVIGAAAVVLFGIFFFVGAADAPKASPNVKAPLQLVRAGGTPVPAPPTADKVDQHGSTASAAAAIAQPKHGAAGLSSHKSSQTGRHRPAAHTGHPAKAHTPRAVGQRSTPPANGPRGRSSAAPNNGAKRQMEARTRIYEGQSQLRRGAYSRAKQAFTAAQGLDPSNAAAHGGLGEVAFELGNYAAAVGHLSNAVRLNPRGTRHMVMLGNVYFKQGKLRHAVSQYRRALNLDPKNREAKSGLDAALRRLGRTG